MQPMTGRRGMNPQTLDKITEHGFESLPEMTMSQNSLKQHNII